MKVFIQNEAGSFIKHYHDEKTLELKGSARVSRAYPFPYGFILGTTAADGCNVDCFVITSKPLRTGQVVECEPVGLMEQMGDGREDHNVLARIQGEDARLDDAVKALLTKFVNHVFDHVEGKNIQVGNFLGRRVALDYVSRRQDHCGAVTDARRVPNW
jgi:inorganic pyrophosphatase